MKADCPAVLFRYAAVLAALLCAAFPLSARSSSRYTIYIAPVSGTGKGPGDNAFFAGALTAKLAANNVTAAGDPERADFILAPELSPMPGQKPSDNLYLLHVTLTERKTDTVIAEQKLIYSSPEETGPLLTIMMGNVFSAITGKRADTRASARAGTTADKPAAKPKSRRADKPADDTDWRSQWLYLGASAFWSPRVYSFNDTQSSELLNFGVGISAEVQFLDFLSAETGLTVVPEWLGALYVPGVDTLDLVLEIPLVVKYIFKPATGHALEPYGGFKVNLPLYGVARPPLLSLCAGFQYGIKAGPGALFADIRFSTDIGDYRFKKTANTETVPYSNRLQIDIGIGYKFGLFPR